MPIQQVKLILREMTPEERHQLEHLAHSRTAQVWLVQRTQILLAFHHGSRPAWEVQRLGPVHATVYHWIRHFNHHGLPGTPSTSHNSWRSVATFSPQFRH